MKKFSSIKDLISVSYGEFIGIGFSALFWFWLASEIIPEEYGQIQFFIGIAGIVGYIATIGTTNTIIVYTAKKIPIHATLYSISLIFAGISFIILFLIYNRIDIGLLVIGYVINFVVIGDLLGGKKFYEYSKFILIQKVLTLALGLGFYYFMGTDGIIYALAITYIPLLIIVYKGFKRTKIDFGLLKKRYRFIFGNYTMQVVGGFTGQLDKIIVVPILGFTVLGNYGLALSFVSIMMLLPNILFNYLLPQESSGINTKSVTKISILVSIGIAITGLLILPEIISLLFPQYLLVSSLIQIMSLGIIPKTLSSIYEARFLGSENSKVVFIGRIAHLGVMISSMIVLGIFYGALGIAYAFLLSNSVKIIFLISINRTKE